PKMALLLPAPKVRTGVDPARTSCHDSLFIAPMNHSSTPPLLTLKPAAMLLGLTLLMTIELLASTVAVIGSEERPVTLIVRGAPAKAMDALLIVRLVGETLTAKEVAGETE